MIPVQCEVLKINHLTPFLVVTMPYACWFLWHAYYIEDFKGRLHFQFGIAFWRVVLKEVYSEGPNRIWRALKTSILNFACHTSMLPWSLCLDCHKVKSDAQASRAPSRVSCMLWLGKLLGLFKLFMKLISNAAVAPPYFVNPLIRLGW